MLKTHHSQGDGMYNSVFIPATFLSSQNGFVYRMHTVNVHLEKICNAGDLVSIPGLGRFPGERKGYPVQYSGLENSMDCIVHGVAKSQM